MCASGLGGELRAGRQGLNWGQRRARRALAVTPTAVTGLVVVPYVGGFLNEDHILSDIDRVIAHALDTLHNHPHLH